MNILITGSSKGIGKALAETYLDQGHTVLGISRSSPEDLKSRKNYYHLSLDLSELDTIQETISGYLKKTDHLHVVVLNAGMLNEIKDLRETSINEIKKVMDVNVWSNKVLIESCFNSVGKIDQIVAVSSGAAVRGSRGWNAYSLSKATLNRLIDLYSKEYTTTHFCALAPGIIDTEMQEYISGLPEEKDYPVVQKLKKAKNTPSMPKPEAASESLVKAIETVRHYDSGSFLDIREL